MIIAFSLVFTLKSPFYYITKNSIFNFYYQNLIFIPENVFFLRFLRIFESRKAAKQVVRK